jgi:hypothetical protein
MLGLKRLSDFFSEKQVRTPLLGYFRWNSPRWDRLVRFGKCRVFSKWPMIAGV